MLEMTQFFSPFYSMKIFVPITLLSFVVLVHANVTGRSLENVKDVTFSDIDKFSISNIAPESDRYEGTVWDDLAHGKGAYVYAWIPPRHSVSLSDLNKQVSMESASLLMLGVAEIRSGRTSNSATNSFATDGVCKRIPVDIYSFLIPIGDGIETVHFFHCYKRGVDRIFVDHPLFLAKIWGKTGGKIYGPMAGEDYEDNQLRFSLLCMVTFFIQLTCMLLLSHFHQQQRRILLRAARLNAELAASEAPRLLNLNNGKYFSGPYGEDVVFVTNDWHSALVSFCLKKRC